MDANDLVTGVLFGLPERVEKLERTIREQHLLIGVLLSRTGLKSPEEIEHVFDWAQSAWGDIEREVSDNKFKEWAKTPEGMEARAKAGEAYARRRIQLWREECLAEGRIVPYDEPPQNVESDD